MICKNCGKEFDGNFCPDCGMAIEEQVEVVEEQAITVCPNCSAERVGNGKFCVNCGYNFEEKSPLTDNGVSKIEQGAVVEEKANKSAIVIDKNKIMTLIAKIYRYLIAGGTLFLGFVSFLCLSAPVITEELLGMKEALCNGFQAIGGGDAPSNVINASRMLLITSILCLAYGGYQLYLAVKKPYSTVKKYYLWAVDGVVSLILIVLGGVISSEAKADGLINGKMGSGFAMCIVMGVFGLLFLGLRIFYELKVFKWEDTGLDEEGIAKAREKKERKPIDKEKAKKIAKKVGIPVVVVAILLAVIIPTVVWSQNIFRAGKVDKINIGDSREQVIKILGEPYVKNNSKYEYYSDDYIKLAEKIKKSMGVKSGISTVAKNDGWDFDFDDDIDLDEDIDLGDSDKTTKLEEQLNKLVYKYIRVEFNSDGKVTEVLYDAEKCESKEYKKVVKNYDVNGETTIQQYDTLKLTYSVKYDDGSLYKGTAVNQVYFDTSSSVEWNDIYGNKYTKEIEIKPITYLTSEIVEIIAGGDKSTLTEFEIVANIESIGDNAFKNCSNLTSIVIPSNVTRIGNSAFYGCSSLTGVYITDIASWCAIDFGDSYANPLSCAHNLYLNNELVTELVIPSGVTSIGKRAFYNCSSLTSIEIPSSVTSIGGSAFNGCSNITTATIPTIAIGYIPKSKLEKVIINGGESIANSAFYGCSSLTSIEISSSVTSIGDDAFDGCSSLRYNEYDNGLYIGNTNNPYMVLIKAKITSITSCEINTNTRFIHSNAFEGCNNLTNIEITSSVTSIGGGAFLDCSSLENITVDVNNTKYKSEGNCIIEKETNVLILGCKNGVIPNYVTRIGNSAFYGCSSLTSIEIPSGVTSIGSSAFYGCSSLTNIEIPSSVTSIGDDAFRDCSNITTATIPTIAIGYIPKSKLEKVIINGGTSIGTYAFYNCSSLTSIVIPSSVTSIGYDAFSGCSSLTSIEIPSSVTRIGFSAFYNCSSLISIEIPSGVTIIDSEAFYGCSSLTSIEIPSSVTRIGSSAFYNCSSLISIEIPSGVTIIDSKAFYGCSSLQYNEYDNGLYLGNKENPYVVLIKAKDESITSCEINTSTKIIYDFAFDYCSSLTSIEIPSSVTSIYDLAFSYCSSLTSIEIPSSVTRIGSSAFYGCSSLTIYCEAESEPSGWYRNWNSSYRPVVWGYKG